MRVDHLSADNQRTQGPERRNWYRRYSAKHVREIEKAVIAALDARSASAPDSAAILGAGACTELPLDRIARACAPVTLVDLDAAGMNRAREELPEKLRSHVRTLRADITGGVSARLQDELRATPWPDLRALKSRRGDAVLDALANCLERTRVEVTPTVAGLEPQKFGLVISSLTLTQLFSLPLLDALDTLLIYAPDVADERDAHARYLDAERTFRRSVTLSHLNLLASLLAPGGVALLVSDRVGYLLAPAKGAHANEDREALEVLPADVLRVPDDLATRFEMEGEMRAWAWMSSMPEGETPGRAYDVFAALLKPRAEPSV